jgi:hypothetical protein
MTASNGRASLRLDPIATPSQLDFNPDGRQLSVKKPTGWPACDFPKCRREATSKLETGMEPSYVLRLALCDTHAIPHLHQQPEWSEWLAAEMARQEAAQAV